MVYTIMTDKKTKWLTSERKHRKLYFAYGSNMNQKQMEYRCPDAFPVAIGRLSRFKFLINSRGVASIIESEIDDTFGVIWQISQTNETTLDRYEGVAKSIYKKIILTADVEEDKVSCLCYQALNNKYGIPREGYLEKVIKGARSFSLNREWIDQLNGWVK